MSFFMRQVIHPHEMIGWKPGYREKDGDVINSNYFKNDLFNLKFTWKLSQLKQKSYTQK